MNIKKLNTQTLDRLVDEDQSGWRCVWCPSEPRPRWVRHYGADSSSFRERNLFSTRTQIPPLGDSALQLCNFKAHCTGGDLSTLYPHRLPRLCFSGWQHLASLWLSGEFTAKPYTDVMKSNICFAVNYEMLFSLGILLLQSLMTIFPFIWLLTL